MNDCLRYHDLIATYAAGDIGPKDLEELLVHSRGCEECRGLIELHRSVATMAVDVPEPAEEVFEAVRSRVLDQLDLEHAQPGAEERVEQGVVASGAPFWGNLVDWFGTHPLPASALVILLLFTAALAGRWTAVPRWSDRSLLQAVEEQAGQSAGLDGFWDATFTFANVAFRQTETGDLSLGFDVCRHVEAEAPMDSPLAGEVLLSTILDSPTLGVRMKAMEIAPDIQNARLREALIYTLHNDPNLAVRVQALGVLSRRPLDATTQDALLRTLRDDTSVQVRLLAIDALAAHQVDPETIRQAVSEAGQASDGVILQHALQIEGQS